MGLPVSALLHPDTTGLNSFLRRLADMQEGVIDLLFENGTLTLSVVKCLLESRWIQNAICECRRVAPKKVLCIDAQFSTFMNVLYQVPHGEDGQYAR